MITKTISFLLLLFYVNVFAQLDHTVSTAYSGDGTEDVIIPIKLDIKLIEEGDFPTGYQGEIMTPVCMDGLCQRVHILIYWDLLGNYQSYELPEGEKLTKTEHEPFSKNDYQKLHEILKKPHSLLQDFDIEKLLKSETLRKVEETDGYTGATAGTLRDHIVEGAVYSSYTLWHLVHGRIVDSLYSHTISELLDDDLFIRFLSSGNHHYHYAALNYINKNPSKYEDSLVVKKLEILINDKNNVFFTRKLLLTMPADNFSKSKWQQVLWSAWPKNKYQVQQLILYKMQDVKQHPEVLPLIAECLAIANPLQKMELLDFFSDKEYLEPEILFILANQLDINQQAVSKKVLHLLKKHQQGQKQLQKLITTFEKQSQLLW